MQPRVLDCVLFNGEFDVLSIRLHELDSVVDRFVIVESDTTFSGLKKPVRFTAGHPAIKQFADRVDFILVEDMPLIATPWERETWQRNAVKRGLSGASDDDLVLMSDVDEIPRAACVRQAQADRAHSIFGFRMRLYYFYMNYRNITGDADLVWTIGATIGRLKSLSPDTLRYDVRNQVVDARIFDDGGWHFSYLMDETAIKQKIRSFSHQEFNRRRFLRRIDIPGTVAQSGDLFGRPGFEWSVVEEPDLPRHVITHKADFRRFFYTPADGSQTVTAHGVMRFLPRHLGLRGLKRRNLS